MRPSVQSEYGFQRCVPGFRVRASPGLEWMRASIASLERVDAVQFRGSARFSREFLRASAERECELQLRVWVQASVESDLRASVSITWFPSRGFITCFHHVVSVTWCTYTRAHCVQDRSRPRARTLTPLLLPSPSFPPSLLPF
eukprot:3254338-Rhodomonas_salina.1